jgi:hypothetical protein
VLDYKTSSKGAKPAEAHLKPVRARDTFPDWQICDYEGKPHRWINLQLPFYAWIVSRLPGHSDGAELVLHHQLPGSAIAEHRGCRWSARRRVALELHSKAAACSRPNNPLLEDIGRRSQG